MGYLGRFMSLVLSGFRSDGADGLCRANVGSGALGSRFGSFCPPCLESLDWFWSVTMDLLSPGQDALRDLSVTMVG